jgi:uncharacterized membrane protein YozB (DUF420 family)
MDPKTAYWTGAFVNMVVIVALAFRGVAKIRRGDIAGHRRAMLAAASLVGLFVASYVVKLFVLGREDLAVWSPGAVTTLRVHELCVLTMLVAGSVAGVRAWQMRAWVDARMGSVVRPEAPVQLRAHRRAGWTAVLGAVLGVLTAAAVLAGMYARAGG